jgi:hypothetical protein
MKNSPIQTLSNFLKRVFIKFVRLRHLEVVCFGAIYAELWPHHFLRQEICPPLSAHVLPGRHSKTSELGNN